jgi:Na+-transporting methylmalonyl-CoA/oxaloacetate decarboxylase gamma subunit
MLQFDFSMTALMDGLKMMGFGMAGIFVVLTIIFLTILLLGKVCKPKETNDGDQQK